MKRTTFLLLTVLWAVTTWAGVAPVSGGEYRIKCASQSFYINSSEAMLSSRGIVTMRTGATVFQLEQDADGNWTIQGKDDAMYLAANGWKLIRQAGSYKWSLVDASNGQYRIKRVDDGTKYVAPDAFAAAQEFFTDKEASNANGLFEFEEVSDAEAIAASREALSTAIAAANALKGTNPGYYQATDVEPLVTVAQAVADKTDATAAELIAAKNALEAGINALTCIMPEAGKTYQIVSAYGKFEELQSGAQKAMYANGTTLSWKTVDNADRAMYWTFTANDDSTYTVQNVKTHKSVNNSPAENGVYTLGDEATSVHLFHFAGTTQFKLYTGDYAMHCGGHNNGTGANGSIIGWNNIQNTASAWNLVEREAPAKTAFDITYKTDDNLWTTTVYDVAAGQPYPTPDLGAKGLFVTFTGIPTGTVSQDETVTLHYTTPVAADKNNIQTYFALDIHTNQGKHLLYADGEKMHSYYHALGNGMAEGVDYAYANGAVPNESHMWAFIGNPFTGVKLYNKGQDKYAVQPSDEDVKIEMGDESAGNVFQICNGSANIANDFALKVEGRRYYLNHRSEDMQGWTAADEGSSLRAFPVEQADMSVSRTLSVEYGTIALPFYAARPEGLTVYTCSAVGSDNVLTLAEISHPGLGNNYLEPNTAYLFLGTVGETYTFTNTTKDRNTDAVTTGLLTGVYTDTQAPAGTYVLQKQNDHLGFYRVDAEGTAIVGANRCYVTAPAQSAGVKGFFFEPETATAIEALEALTSGKAEIFDLQGRRLPKLQKGINIVGGKKVIVK